MAQGSAVLHCCYSKHYAAHQRNKWGCGWLCVWYFMKYRHRNKVHIRDIHLCYITVFPLVVYLQVLGWRQKQQDIDVEMVVNTEGESNIQQTRKNWKFNCLDCANFIVSTVWQWHLCFYHYDFQFLVIALLMMAGKKRAYYKFEQMALHRLCQNLIVHSECYVSPAHIKVKRERILGNFHSE